MLSCRELNEQQASDFLDGRLSFGKRLSVRIHLAGCKVCRRFMAQLRIVKRVLQDKPETLLTDTEAKTLAARLHTAFQQQQKISSG